MLCKLLEVHRVSSHNMGNLKIFVRSFFKIVETFMWSERYFVQTVFILSAWHSNISIIPSGLFRFSLKPGWITSLCNLFEINYFDAVMMLLTRTHLCISGKLLSTILSLPSKRLSGIGTGCPGSLVTMKSVTSGRCNGWYLLGFSHLLEKSRHKNQFFDILDLIMITLQCVNRETVVRYFLPQN